MVETSSTQQHGGMDACTSLDMQNYYVHTLLTVTRDYLAAMHAHASLATLLLLVREGERRGGEGDLHRHQDEPGFEAAQPVEERPAGRGETRAVRCLVAERDGGGFDAKRDVSFSSILSVRHNRGARPVDAHVEADVAVLRVGTLRMEAGTILEYNFVQAVMSLVSAWLCARRRSRKR